MLQGPELGRLENLKAKDADTWQPDSFCPFLLFLLDLFMYIGVFFVCMCTTAMPSATEGVGSPGTGTLWTFEPPCGSWEPNLGPLKEQVLLNPPNHLSGLLAHSLKDHDTVIFE